MKLQRSEFNLSDMAWLYVFHILLLPSPVVRVLTHPHLDASNKRVLFRLYGQLHRYETRNSRTARKHNRLRPRIKPTDGYRPRRPIGIPRLKSKLLGVLALDRRRLPHPADQSRILLLVLWMNPSVLAHCGPVI
jgi:hypothetical protein